MTQSGAGQACSTGNLQDCPPQLYSRVPRLTFTLVGMVTLIAILLWIAIVTTYVGEEFLVLVSWMVYSLDVMFAGYYVHISFCFVGKKKK